MNWNTPNRPDIDLSFTNEQIDSVPRQGPADDAIAALIIEMVDQTMKLNLDNLREELSEYGAWDSEELSDNNANIERWIWISVYDTRENRE